MRMPRRSISDALLIPKIVRAVLLPSKVTLLPLRTQDSVAKRKIHAGTRVMSKDFFSKNATWKLETCHSLLTRGREHDAREVRVRSSQLQLPEVFDQMVRAPCY